VFLLYLSIFIVVSTINLTLLTNKSIALFKPGVSGVIPNNPVPTATPAILTVASLADSTLKLSGMPASPSIFNSDVVGFVNPIYIILSNSSSNI